MEEKNIKHNGITDKTFVTIVRGFNLNQKSLNQRLIFHISSWLFYNLTFTAEPAKQGFELALAGIGCLFDPCY